MTKADIQSLSGQKKIVQFVQSVNPPLMIFITVVIAFTCSNPLLTVPLCLLPPIVGTIGLKMALKNNWKYFPLFMTIFAATNIIFVCWTGGPKCPTFLAAYTNVVFAVFNIRKYLHKILSIALCFICIISGCLLAGMEPFYLFTGIICALAYVFVLLRVLNFVLNLSSEIALQRDEIEKQKEVVVEQQKELKDSIHYARRIQQALLASDNLLNTHLSSPIRGGAEGGGEYFIFFQPKDIVSGDFYWATQAHGKFYLAIADSTGHGVPGAFMSLLNISFLNEAINEKQIQQPAEILNHVRKRLINALKDDGSEEGGKDGMDCILLAFDFSPLSPGEGQGVRLEFACANNSLLLVRNAEPQFFDADKMAVGRSPRQDVPFTNQSIELQKGDAIYAYTDGYADQFGGIKGKKFKYKQLEELILNSNGLPCAERKKLLHSTIESWKGNLEQVDDILVAGITID